MTEEEAQKDQVYHHQINKGGLDDILSNRRMRSSEAKAVAGGSAGVRAYTGPCDASQVSGNTTVIEFRCTRPPDSVHPRNGTATWRIPDGDYLKIESVRVHRNGLTVDNPRSVAEMEAGFQRQSRSLKAEPEFRDAFGAQRRRQLGTESNWLKQPQHASPSELKNTAEPQGPKLRK